MSQADRQEGNGARADQIDTVVRVVRLAALGVYRSQLPRMAAAMAYRTVFGLLPLFVIGLVVLGAFTSNEDKRVAVTRALQFSGLSEIVVEPAATPAAPPARSAAAWGVGGFLPRETSRQARHIASSSDFDAALAAAAAGEVEAPEVPMDGRLDAWITDRVEEISEIRLGAVGLAGFLTLVYAAISMLVEMERSFNHIYRVRVGRSWTRRVMQYWTVLTLGVVSLVVTFGVSEGAEIWLRRALGVSEDAKSLLAFALSFVVTITLSTLLFFLMYATVPNTRVHIRPALTGAAVAAVLWELGKWGFTAYLEFTTVYASLYNSIALIPLFLLWVYVTWLIILFGLQVSQMLQTFREWADDKPGDDTPPFVDPSVAIDFAVMAAAAFAKGKPLTLDEASSRSGLAPVVVRPILDGLEEAGVLHRIAEDDDRQYALARPPGAIPAGEVLAVGEVLADRSDRVGPAAAAAERLRGASREALRGETLASVAGLPAEGSAPDAKPDSASGAPPHATPEAAT